MVFLELRRDSRGLWQLIPEYSVSACPWREESGTGDLEWEETFFPSTFLCGDLKYFFVPALKFFFFLSEKNCFKKFFKA